MKFNFKIPFLILFLISGFTLFAQQNPRISFLKSAVLPGWGELSNNNKTGYIFIATEAMLWFSKYYYTKESTLYEEASLLHAIRYAHIDSNQNFSETYYNDLKRYRSYGFDSGGYNANIVMQAKDKFPDDIEEQQNYIQENMYEESYYWHWDDKEKQNDYKILRKRIVQYSDYSKAVTGFIILNHLVSALNSVRISTKLKRVELQATFENQVPGIACEYKF